MNYIKIRILNTIFIILIKINLKLEVEWLAFKLKIIIIIKEINLLQLIRN